MKKEQILAATKKYRAWLDDHGVKPNSYPREKRANDAYLRLSHASWMCEEIPEIAKKDLAKAERWLCFIQGVLWSNGVYSVDDFREDNRP